MKRYQTATRNLCGDMNCRQRRIRYRSLRYVGPCVSNTYKYNLERRPEGTREPSGD